MPNARGISEFGAHCPLVDTEARVTQGSEISTSESNPLHDWVPDESPFEIYPRGYLVALRLVSKKLFLNLFLQACNKYFYFAASILFDEAIVFLLSSFCLFTYCCVPCML